MKAALLKKEIEFEGARTSTISGYTDSPVQVKTLDKDKLRRHYLGQICIGTDSPIYKKSGLLTISV